MAQQGEITESLICKIIVNQDISFEELIKKVEQGGRFITFQYCISFLAVTLERYSPAIFFEKDENMRPYQNKYNLISYLFGWWGPWGPKYTIKFIRHTLKGGLDVTDDVMLNIDEESFYRREYEFIKTNRDFDIPDKWDVKEFRKAIKPVFERDFNLRKIVFGNYLNTGIANQTIYTIGIRCQEDFDKYPQIFKTALKTRFIKSTRFDFLDLNENTELNQHLEQQGGIILDRD